MKKEKVSSISICILIFLLTKACFLGVGFHYIFLYNNPSSILNVLIGIIFGYIFLFIFLKVHDTNIDKSFFEKINIVFNNPINYVIKFFLIILCISLAILAFWRNIDFISTQYLSKTPTFVIGLLFISIIYYTLKTNTEVFTRFCTIVFFITAIMITINFNGLITEIKLDNLKPFLYDLNPGNMLLPSLFFSILFAGPLFFLNIIPKNNIVDKQKFKKTAIICYTISGIDLFLIFFIILASLGLDIINLFKYPPYIVLKKINYFSFISSIENITFILWYFYLQALSLTSLLFIKNNLFFKKKLSNIKNNFFSILTSLIVFIIPLIFLNNNKSLTIKIIDYSPIVIFSCFILISFFYLIMYTIKKKIY